MLRDLRHGVRMLLQAKGWTAVVVISLALGIGANTALFSAINGLLLKKLPVKDPDTLVRLRYAGRNDMVTSSSDYGFTTKDAAGRDMRTTFSYPMFQQFVADNRTMTDLFACAPFGRVNVVVDGQAEIATSFISTGNYYRMLGVTARLGRTITPEDDRPAAPPVAVISFKYWRSRFGSNPNVVGKRIQINSVPVTIVGVLPPEFTGVQHTVGDAPDVAVPLAADAQLTSGGGPLVSWASAARADRASAHPSAQPTDVLVAAGHGPTETWRDGGAGARQPRRRVSKHGARRARFVSWVLVAGGAFYGGEPQPQGRAAPGRRIGQPRDLRR